MRQFFLLVAVLVSSISFPSLLVADDRGAARLASVLTGRNEQNRFQLLQAMQTDLELKLSALDGLVTAVEKNATQIAKGRELLPSHILAIRTLCSIDRESAYQCVVKLLDHDEHRLAMIAAESLGHNQRATAIDAIKRQVDRPQWDTVYGFRFSMVRALVEMDHPDAYEFLRIIRQRVDGQLAHELDKVLNKVPATNPVNEKVKLVEGAPSSLKRLQLERPRYYGISIEGNAVLFVMDRTCSMKTISNNGTKLGQAKEISTETIDQLPENFKFGVLTFDNNVHQWNDRLMLATKENKQDAIRYVRRQKVGDDRKNVHGALQQAIEFDDELEEVFLLTDGAPKVGPPPENIINEIVFRNQLRHIKINTIGVGLNPRSRIFLQTLAKKCNGVFLEPAQAGNVAAQW